MDAHVYVIPMVRARDYRQDNAPSGTKTQKQLPPEVPPRTHLSKSRAGAQWRHESWSAVARMSPEAHQNHPGRIGGLPERMSFSLYQSELSLPVPSFGGFERKRKTNTLQAEISRQDALGSAAEDFHDPEDHAEYLT